MKISILIPCHNEEKAIRRCVLSCLRQTSPPDEIVVVNDGSTDRSREILDSFGEEIKVVHISKATGNKSYAQEHGLRFVTGDIFISTDGDTVLDRNFVEQIRIDFQNPSVVAVSGYVKSMKYNWLTACRAFEYSICQNIHKLAQHHIGFIFVIPGAAGAFRRDIFKKYIPFDHDTLTEDLDFTYRLNKRNLKIVYNRKAIVYTEDPSDLRSYINQLRRWQGGGWQNLMKHFDIFLSHPKKTLELSMIYMEGLVFSVLIFLMPLINLGFFLKFIPSYFIILFLLASYAALVERRLDILLASPMYFFLVFVNAGIFLEQFVREIILRKKNLAWFQPKRKISC